MAVATLPSAADIAEALGGETTFKRRVRTADELRTSVLRGLPYKALEAMIAHYSLARDPVTSAIAVSARTLARRKHGARFVAEESDRIVRLARIAALAENVLGTPERAGRWLQRPNRALGGGIPLERLSTDLGAREVEGILTRIEHGIPS